MADVLPNAPRPAVSRRVLSAVERWAERASTVRDSRRLDAFIAVCFVVLALLVCSMLIAGYVADSRSVVFHREAACAEPLRHHNDTSRHANRTLARVEQALIAGCDENQTATTAHQVRVAGVPYGLAVARLCATETTLVNPEVVHYGEYSGKCEETVGNVTLVKRRWFPMRVNHSGGRLLNVHSLGSACAVQHALELMSCTWHAG